MELASKPWNLKKPQTTKTQNPTPKTNQPTKKNPFYFWTLGRNYPILLKIISSSKIKCKCKNKCKFYYWLCGGIAILLLQTHTSFACSEIIAWQLWYLYASFFPILYFLVFLSPHIYSAPHTGSFFPVYLYMYAYQYFTFLSPLQFVNG